jgi:hypothetical protein
MRSRTETTFWLEADLVHLQDLATHGPESRHISPSMLWVSLARSTRHRILEWQSRSNQGSVGLTDCAQSGCSLRCLYPDGHLQGSLRGARAPCLKAKIVTFKRYAHRAVPRTGRLLRMFSFRHRKFPQSLPTAYNPECVVLGPRHYAR